MIMKNKGFILISSVFLVLFLGIIIGTSLIRSEIQLRQVDLRRASQDAFYAAESGVEKAIYELRNNPTWRNGFNDIASQCDNGGGILKTVGFYTVSVADGAPVNNMPTIWLLSQGQDSEKKVSRYIRARLSVENPATYFTSTMGDLILGSGATIGGNILGRDVIFEVNFALPPPQRNITVNGDVEYIRNIEGEGNSEVSITGQILQRSPITFVSVDLARYRALAQSMGGYINGDFTYSGEINWGNLSTSNGLVFAEGDIYISGNVTESMHFVSAKDIYIEDDITCDSQVQIGLSAAGDVIIPGGSPSDITIDAFINANGGLFKAEGNKGSKNTLDFEGAIAVRGKSGERTAVDLNVFSVRNYTYDTSLGNNLQIPFMSFMANIFSWEEVGPNAIIPPPSY